MIRGALAAALAAGAILPQGSLLLPKPEVYVPARPSLVRAESLETSRHMLLGMPFTMGMLKPRSNASTFVTTASSTSSSTSFTFSSVSIGAAASNRVVVVAAAAGDTTANGISSCTIGGVSATGVAVASGSGSMRGVAIYQLVVTSGATANIVVGLPSTASGMVIAVYALYLASTPALDSATGTTTATSAAASSLTTVAGGWGIAVSHHRNTNTTSWSSSPTQTLNSRFNGSVNSINAAIVDFIAVSATTTASITASWSGSNNGSIAAATWNL